METIIYRCGQVLIPLMYEQFVERPTTPQFLKKNADQLDNVIKIERDDFYTGAGMVRAIPGPGFSIAASCKS